MLKILDLLVTRSVCASCLMTMTNDVRPILPWSYGWTNSFEIWGVVFLAPENVNKYLNRKVCPIWGYFYIKMKVSGSNI